MRAQTTQGAAIEAPIVIVPVGTDDAALDACLAALERGTSPDTRVWLADDAQAGPRGYAIIERWLARTALKADYTRRQRSIGEAAHLDEVLTACGSSDVAVLAADAMPLPGWLDALTACLQADGAVATATPWCNAGEAAAWPRIGEINPSPQDLERLARAASNMQADRPELPAAVGHAVLLRGSARLRAGGLDAASYGSWYAALIDLSLRLSGLGWRNVLCDSAFVARAGEGCVRDGDMEHIRSRWPGWHARLAGFLMEDPLHAARARLSALLDTTEPLPPQADLFPRSEPEVADPSSSAASAAASTRNAGAPVPTADAIGEPPE